jgi:CheY-like chemotaxis protein
LNALETILAGILSESMVKIIVADDTKEDLVLIHRILQQVKLLNPVLLVNGAAECVEKLKTMQRGRGPAEPSLMLIDLIMPQESGLDVLRYLQNSDYRDCVVVMLSGLRDVKAIHEGYQLGAKTFLLKPLTVMDVVELVNSLPEISIEERDAGYVLHWRERMTPDSDLRRTTTRIKTLAA